MESADFDSSSSSNQHRRPGNSNIASSNHNNAFCHICNKEVVGVRVTRCNSQGGEGKDREEEQKKPTSHHSVGADLDNPRDAVGESVEYQCSECNSTFVELIGQGIHEFLGITANDAALRRSEVDTVDDRSGAGFRASAQSNGLSPLNEQHNNGAPNANARNVNGGEMVMQIVSRVLGMGVQTSPGGQSTLLDLLQQTSAASGGRPVGVVVRQNVSGSDLLSISQALSGNSGSAIAAPQISTPNTGNAANIGGGLPATNDFQSLLNLLIGGLPVNPAGMLGGPPIGGSLDDILHHILMHERSHAGVPPSSAETIQSLKRIAIGLDTDTGALGECSISQEKFTVGDVCVMLNCGHNFKQEAIERWLTMHGTCPTCRIRVSEQ
jgi:hypothetical protein